MRRSEQRRAAVFALYQSEQSSRPLAELLQNGGHEATEFTRELAEGVQRQQLQIDDLIAKYAIDWKLERIAPLERSILRVAIYEILFVNDVPTEVAIDEAVELAKRYCSKEAPAFVNGILGAVAGGRNGQG